MSPSASTLNPTRNSSAVMGFVMLCLVPGTLTMAWYFGPGIIVNVVLAAATAAVIEALVMLLRRRDPLAAIGDGSAMLAGWLLALALPPYLSPYLTVFGASIAMLLGKHLYGGLGKNPFNPAMVAYAFLLVSFPQQLTAWITPHGQEDPSIWTLWLQHWPESILNWNRSSWDAITKATPLDQLKSGAELSSGFWLGDAWKIINLAFLAGGLCLLWARVITWHIPLTILCTASVLYAVDHYFFEAILPVSSAMFSGAMMLGAFFIATDPVSAATSKRGRIIYAVGIGILIFSIRKWSAYPEGVAFAVLLMNTATPAIDYYHRPRLNGNQQ